MYPTAARPALGIFVRGQVEALRALSGVEVEVFAFEPGGASAYTRAALELRRRHRGRRFDVIHAHYGLSGWVALTLPGAPHVVTFHGTDLAHRVVGPLSRRLAHLVALPAPVSGSLARRGLPPSVRRGRVAVLPTGVDLDRFQPLDRDAARAQLGLEPDGRYLLFPSDPRRPEKRFDRARALASALAGVELLTYRDVHPDRVPLLVNAANAVAVTSEREGFGLGPLEALACDVPVAATDVGVARLAVEGVPGTLCAPFDVDRWRAALAPYMSDPGARVAGRARAALFDRRRLAERTLAAYRDIVAQRR